MKKLHILILGLVALQLPINAGQDDSNNNQQPTEQKSWSEKFAEFDQKNLGGSFASMAAFLGFSKMQKYESALEQKSAENNAADNQALEQEQINAAQHLQDQLQELKEHHEIHYNQDHPALAGRTEFDQLNEAIKNKNVTEVKKLLQKDTFIPDASNVMTAIEVNDPKISALLALHGAQIDNNQVQNQIEQVAKSAKAQRSWADWLTQKETELPAAVQPFVATEQNQRLQKQRQERKAARFNDKKTASLQEIQELEEQINNPTALVQEEQIQEVSPEPAVSAPVQQPAVQEEVQAEPAQTAVPKKLMSDETAQQYLASLLNEQADQQEQAQQAEQAAQEEELKQEEQNKQDDQQEQAEEPVKQIEQLQAIEDQQPVTTENNVQENAIEENSTQENNIVADQIEPVPAEQAIEQVQEQEILMPEEDNLIDQEESLTVEEEQPFQLIDQATEQQAPITQPAVEPVQSEIISENPVAQPEPVQTEKEEVEEASIPEDYDYDYDLDETGIDWQDVMENDY